MKIEKNKVVSLTYRLHENDKNGVICDEATESKPFIFLFGHNNLIEGFERNIDGLEVGNDFSFTLEPKEAYGEYVNEDVLDLPINVFMQDGKINTDLLQVDRMISMQDQEGRVFTGMVKAIETESVKIDFNHPMAGKTLFFIGKITDIRDAEEAEIEQGHIHSHDCSCGCH